MISGLTQEGSASRADSPSRTVNPFTPESVHGMLKDLVGTLPESFCLRITNLTSKTAFFQFGVTGESIPRPLLAAYVSQWPTREEQKLFVAVPPNVWRNVHVSAFNLSYTPRPTSWTLSVTEFYHSRMFQAYRWPEELKRPIDELATDIPWGSTHADVEYVSVPPTKVR